MILAGVTIATLTGNHGILTQVDNAKVSDIEAKVNEEIGLAVQSANLKIRTKTATDNSWNATTDENIQIIKGILEEDLKEDKGYKVTPEELNTGTGTRKIRVEYTGSDYRKATKKDNAKITKTLDVSQNKIIYGDCNHDWVDGEVIEATCTEAGSKKQTCTKCGETKTVTIEARHNFVDGVCTRCTAIFSGNLKELYPEITWAILEDIAKQVSQDTTIRAETTETASDIVTSVTKTVGGKEYTISLNNWMPVEYGDSSSKVEKKARIIGFKHDVLADGTVYGKTASNPDTYAGISFEFVNTLGSEKMNNPDTNVGGWEKCELRVKLLPTDMKVKSTENTYGTGEYYEKLPIVLRDEIKTVKKKWNTGDQNVAGLSQETQDKLWLLSNEEIIGDWSGKLNPLGVRYGYYTVNDGNDDIYTKYYGASTSTSRDSWWHRTYSFSCHQFMCFIDCSWRVQQRLLVRICWCCARLFNLASLCKPNLDNNKALKN